MRWAGLAVGALTAAALLSAWRVPASPARTGATLSVAVSAPGELRTSSPVLLAETTLSEAGGTVSGSVVVANRTRRSVAVQARLPAAGSELDGGVGIELRAGGRPLARGPLGVIGSEHSAALVLRPRRRARLVLRATVAKGGDAAIAGRSAAATLTLTTRWMR